MRRVVFKARFLWIVLLAMVIGGWPMAAQAAALPTAPSLGTAANFAVLAGSAVTCSATAPAPAGSVTGDVGVSPGKTVTGFPPQAGAQCKIINGTIDLAATQAMSDLQRAYNRIATHLTPCQLKSGTLDGQSLVPGVYCFAAAAVLKGTLTLTGTGPWIFEIGTSGTGYLEATNFNVVMAPGSNPCNVFWWVHDYVTLTTSTFQGTILAGAAITLTGTTLTGRALASGRASHVPTAVTMTDSNIINTCGSNPAGCNQGSGKDTDENADKSNDAADQSAPAKSATVGASNSSTGDSEDKNGKQDSDEGNKGCNSDNSNKDNSNKDKKS